MFHRSLLLPRATACLLALVPAAGFAAPALSGRLVDGTAMLRHAGVRSIGDEGFLAAAERVPLADRPFRLEVVEGVARGRSWSGRTDAEGRFELALEGAGETSLPAGRSLVASVEDGPTPLYSLGTEAAADGETEFRLYELSEDPSFLFDTLLQVLFTLVDDPAGGGKLLDVRVILQAFNYSGELFVGSVLPGASSRRSALRLPMPDGAVVVSNRLVSRSDGALLGTGTVTPDGWVLLDSPLPPYPEAPEGVEFRLRYRTRAYQENVFAFPLDIPLQRGMFVQAVHLDMDMTSLHLKAAPPRKMPDPDDPTGLERTWNILYGTNLPQDQTVSVGLTIDSIVLRQVNRGALRFVGGLVLGSLLALVAGFALSRRAPRVEALLSQASGEEIIERIAQLDAEFERKRIGEAEYGAAREKLLGLARYELPAGAAPLTRAAGAGADGAAGGVGAAGAPRLSPRVLDVVRRVNEIGREGSGDPRKVQERLILLEDLAKLVEAEAGGETRPPPAEGGP